MFTVRQLKGYSRYRTVLLHINIAQMGDALFQEKTTKTPYTSRKKILTTWLLLFSVRSTGQVLGIWVVLECGSAHLRRLLYRIANVLVSVASLANPLGAHQKMEPVSSILRPPSVLQHRSCVCFLCCESVNAKVLPDEKKNNTAGLRTRERGARSFGRCLPAGRETL